MFPENAKCKSSRGLKGIILTGIKRYNFSTDNTTLFKWFAQ